MRKPPLAPLSFPCVRSQLSAHDRAFGFESYERDFDFASCETEWSREREDSYRPEPLQTIAQEFDQRVIACRFLLIVHPRFNRWHTLSIGEHRVEFGQALGGDVNCRRVVDLQARRALRCQRDPESTAATRHDHRSPPSLKNPRLVDAACNLIGAARLGPYFLAHSADRIGVELAEIAALRHPSSGAPSRPAYALLQRCVVKVGVRPRGRISSASGEGSVQITRDHLDVAALDSAQHALEAVDVHRFVQAIVDRLSHQRVIGYLAVTDDVLAARHLIGEDRCKQIFDAMRCSCGATL